MAVTDWFQGAGVVIALGTAGIAWRQAQGANKIAARALELETEDHVVLWADSIPTRGVLRLTNIGLHTALDVEVAYVINGVVLPPETFGDVPSGGHVDLDATAAADRDAREKARNAVESIKAVRAAMEGQSPPTEHTFVPSSAFECHVTWKSPAGRRGEQTLEHGALDFTGD
ncbi:hypothetical protein [Luteipulveratus mongoliensis]|uniref:Uncharacterized protein n=1 Tax=Luteipulveratus mongoliensis TaxID=571913 RepID=A0A0K1JH81_9MICO|nr:hypothetical protein [Luteipulveratus mongoliensis]AKU16069.1 hypothetical protein VV02_09705 [Luteipulveratus mongoliensis]